MLKFLKTTIKKLFKERPKEELNRYKYPPMVDGIISLELVHVIEGQKEILNQIYKIIETDEEWDSYYKPVIIRYARMVHLLPASEAHHHRGIGGLFRHGLEVGLEVLKEVDQHLYGLDLVPEYRLQAKKRYFLAAFISGLCHDLGKMMDMVITGRDKCHKEYIWNPFNDSLYDWLEKHKIERYFVTWKRNRQTEEHERLSQFLIDLIIPTEFRTYLSEFDRTMLLRIYRGIQRDIYNEPLAEIVMQADQKSTSRDLKLSNLKTDIGNNISVPAYRFYIDTIRRLLSTWKINESGSRLWVIDKRLFMVWPAVGEDIRSVLIKERINWMPLDPKTIFDILLENDFIKSPSEDKRYWKIVPKKLQTREDSVVSLYAIEVKYPEILFDVLPVSVEGFIFPDMEEEEIIKRYKELTEMEEGSAELKAETEGDQVGGEDQEDSNIPRKQQAEQVAVAQEIEPKEEKEEKSKIKDEAKGSVEMVNNVCATSQGESTKEVEVSQQGEESRHKDIEDRFNESRSYFSKNCMFEELFLFLAEEVSMDKKEIGKDIIIGEEVALLWQPKRKFLDGSGLQAGDVFKELKEIGWLKNNPAILNGYLFDIDKKKYLKLEQEVGEHFKNLIKYYRYKRDLISNKEKEGEPKETEQRFQSRDKSISSEDSGSKKLVSTNTSKKASKDISKVSKYQVKDKQSDSNIIKEGNKEDLDLESIIEQELDQREKVTLEEVEKIYKEITGRNVVDPKILKLLRKKYRISYENKQIVIRRS